MKHAPRCSSGCRPAPAEPRAKGPQINAAAGGPGAARPAGYGHVDDALTRTGTGPWTTLRVAHRPAPSPTCPQPSTNVDEPSKPELHTLAASTTDRRSARPRGQASPGSYLVWKRLAQCPADRPAPPVKTKPSLAARRGAAGRGNPLAHCSEDGLGRNAGATVGAALNLASQRSQLHGAKLFAIFERTQPVTNDLACTGISATPNLLLDERFEVIPDDIARRHGSVPGCWR